MSTARNRCECIKVDLVKQCLQMIMLSRVIGREESTGIIVLSGQHRFGDPPRSQDKHQPLTDMHEKRIRDGPRNDG